MEEEYYVKISGANVVYTRVDTIKSMLRRLKRLKMELEDVKKERAEKRKYLIKQLEEASETMKFIEKNLPKKGKVAKVETKRAEKVKKEKTKKPTSRMKKKSLGKPTVSGKTVRELSDLRSELEKLKKELED